MPKSNTLLLLILLLTACSQESPHGQNSSSWSLNPPKLVSHSKGTDYSLKELKDKNLDALMSTDTLHFDSSSIANVRMTVHSTCSHKELRTQHIVDMPLRNQFTIAEILPPQSRLQGQWVCSFQFVARNQKGSEHYFELQQFPIVDDAENQIHVNKNPSLNESVMRIFGDEPSQTFLTTKGIGKTQILCGEYILATDQIKKVLSISEFTNDGEPLPKDRSTLCRAFEINGENRTIASSALFYRSPRAAQLKFSELRDPRNTYRHPHLARAKPILSWGIENLSDKPLYIAVKRKLVSEKIKIMTYYNRKFIAEPLQVSVSWRLFKKELNIDPDYFVFEIPRQAFVQLGVESPHRWICGMWEHGFYFQNKNNNLEALILHKPELVSQANLVQKIDLNTYESKWIGLKQQNIDFNGTHAQKFGPYDSQGALPVAASEERTQYCRNF